MITQKLGLTRYFVGLLFLWAALVVGCSDAPEPSRGGGGKQPRIMSYADAEKSLAAVRIRNGDRGKAHMYRKDDAGI